MEYNKIIEIISKAIDENGGNHANFIVEKNNGKKNKIQFFKSKDGYYCMKTNSRANYGFHIGMFTGYDWKSIVPRKPFKPSVKLARKRAKECVDMLTRSGLWKPMKEQMEQFLRMSDSQIAQFIKDCKEDFYELVYNDKEKRYGFITYHEVFASLTRERCWESIPFNSWSRARKTSQLHDAIINKKNYSDKWSNGYDCSVEVAFDDDKEGAYNRGWMSKEYVGCGNGHYYLLLDEKHAVFYEDD